MATLSVKIADIGAVCKDGSTSTAGHMWVSIDQDGAGTIAPVSFSGWRIPAVNKPIEKNLVDDYYGSSTYYTGTLAISDTQYSSFKTKLTDFQNNPSKYGFDPKYDESTNSCVDFAWKALNIIGLNPSNFEGDKFLLPRFNADDADKALFTYGFGGGSYTAPSSYSGYNVIYGGASNDFLGGGAGNETLNGGANNDSIDAGGGNDSLDGGTGDDVLNGGSGGGNDVLNGGAGVDTASYLNVTSGVTVDLNKTTAQNTVGAGYDTITNIENISGTAYSDTLLGNGLNNVLDGREGSDFLNGMGGNDTLNGGTGNDSMDGGAGNDSLDGGTNDDVLNGGTGSGNDTLNGGTGVDTASYLNVTAAVSVDLRITGSQNTVGAGSDKLTSIENVSGTGYNDTLLGNSVNNVLNGREGSDSLNGMEGNDTLIGGIGNDSMDGGADNDSLNGGTGNDVLNGGGIGNDTLNGGDDIDTASYLNGTAGIKVDLNITTSQNTVGAGWDTLINIENLKGGSGNDTLKGNALANMLEGQSGSDVLYGNAGNDTLYGGLANDTLYGGANNDFLDGGAGIDILYGEAGNDIFSFWTAADANGDTVKDFVRGVDKISLSLIDANRATTVDNSFAKLLSGTITPASMVASSLFFNTTQQVLYGNVDGTTSAPDFAIQLTGVTSLAIADIIA